MARPATNQANDSDPVALRTTANPAPLTSNQVRGFWASWGGWALDGMDSFV